MKKYYSFTLCLFTICILMNTQIAKAQNSPCYSIIGIPYAQQTLLSPTALPNLGDDLWSPVINIGFPFCFFGNTYSQCIIGANGSLGFNIANANTLQSWHVDTLFPSPLPADMRNTINVPWQDLYPAMGGQILYETQGTAPFRRFIVHYKDVPQYGGCNPFNGQVILYESLNNIETHIHIQIPCTNWNDGHTIHGIQNATGTEASVVPGRNVDTFFVYNWGEGVRWTPICSCPSVAAPNVISGKVFLDNNANCIQDAGEPGLANERVRLDPLSYIYYTDALGNYSMSVDTGNFSVSQVPSLHLTQLCPAADYPVYFSSSPMSFPNADFADTAKHCPELSAGISGHFQRVCSRNNLYITCCNNSMYPANNVVLTVTLHDSTFLISPTNYIANPGPNVYQYSLGNIPPEQCVYFTIVDSVDCNVPGHSIFCFEASVTSDSADCDTSDNHDEECAITTTSNDPNDKFVASRQFALNGYVTQENIYADDMLTYTIHFQNNGNDTAFKVVVTDTLSPFLDFSSLRLISSSHSCNVVINGNVAVFSFNNILLPDSTTDEAGSNGLLKFSMAQRTGNLPGTVIHNKAAIYFDLHLPVITNQTENIIAAPASVAEIKNAAMMIYPNPARHSFTVSSGGDMALHHAELKIYDVTGRAVYGQTLNSKQEMVNCNLTTGLYFVKVYAGRNVFTQKLVIE
jgi:uncharacterized repeat protein (TIGR01451 family)